MPGSIAEVCVFRLVGVATVQDYITPDAECLIHRSARSFTLSKLGWEASPESLDKRVDLLADDG